MKVTRIQDYNVVVYCAFKCSACSSICPDSAITKAIVGDDDIFLPDGSSTSVVKNLLIDIRKCSCCNICVETCFYSGNSILTALQNHCSDKWNSSTGGGSSEGGSSESGGGSVGGGGGSLEGQGSTFWGDQMGTDIGLFAFEYVKEPLRDQRRYGVGDSLVDCSLLAQEIATHFNVTSFPRTSSLQKQWFKDNGIFSTDASQIQSGDFVFYINPGHVAIACVDTLGVFGVVHATRNKGKDKCIKFSPIDKNGKLPTGFTNTFDGFGRFHRK